MEMSAEKFPKGFDDEITSRVEEESTVTKSKVPHNCTKAFDSLYFCYSPFHQARQYYRNGELDNCRGRLKRFRLCLMSRLMSHNDSERVFAQEEQRDRQSMGMEDVKPIWEFREEYLENLARAEQQEDKELQTPHEKERWWI